VGLKKKTFSLVIEIFKNLYFVIITKKIAIRFTFIIIMQFDCLQKYD